MRVAVFISLIVLKTVKLDSAGRENDEPWRKYMPWLMMASESADH